MAFKLSAAKTVQISYLGGYLCEKDIELELIYAVESVRQDDSGKVKASLSVRYDDAAKIIVGDYQVAIESDSATPWAEQAEAQIMVLSDFTGAEKL